MAFFASDFFQLACPILIGAVWVFHGLYSKLLNGIPRHQAIVARILGETHAWAATKTIGVLEVMLGVWVFTGVARIECAFVQTAALVAMNSLEIVRARSLLISALGMALLNLLFLTLVWHWAWFAQDR